LDLPTAEPLPQGYPGPELLPNQPLPCKFSSESTTERPPFQDVQFSEPQLLLPGYAEIIEVLPDNHRVLLSRWDVIEEVRTPYTLETLDFTTGETHVYAHQLSDPSAITWLDENQAVAFIERNPDTLEAKMWLSYGDPDNVPLALGDLSLINTDTPLPTTVPAELAQQIRKKMPVDFTQWRYNKFPNNERYAEISKNVGLKWVINSNSTQVAVYGFPWLFLADTQIYRPCEVDIQKLSPSERYGAGMHAIRAEWSADGRFLAMLVEPEHFGNLLPFANVAVLDAMTGAWYESGFDFEYVADFAWLGDSRHLVVQGQVNEAGLRHIILIDTLAQAHQVLPFDQIGQIYQGLYMRTSPDGQNFLFMCGEGEHYGVCLSSITLP
jgi:hypothetical protein